MLEKGLIGQWVTQWQQGRLIEVELVSGTTVRGQVIAVDADAIEIRDADTEMPVLLFGQGIAAFRQPKPKPERRRRDSFAQVKPR